MWNPNSVPASDGSADLVITSTQFWPVPMGQNFNINTLTFGAGGHTLQSGDTLTFSNAGAGITSTGSNTIEPNVVLAAANTWTSHSGLLAVSGSINNGGNLLTIAGSGNVTLSGAISGTGGLVKNDSGTLTLSAANSYAGMTIVNEGTVVISNGGLPDSQNLVVNGGTVDFSGGIPTSLNNLSGNAGAVTNSNAGGPLRELRVTNSTDSSFGGAISGKLSLKKEGSGRLTLTGSNTFTGDVEVDDGTLELAGAASLPNGKSITFSNAAGVLDLTGTGATVSALVGAGTVTNSSANARTLTIDHNSTQSFAGALSGNLGFVKTGNGKLTLTGNLTHSGGTTIQNGTLVVNGSINSPVQIDSGATLGGSGTVGALSGGGRVSPGNSPGILTSASVDAASGMEFAFEFTAPGSPDYDGSPSAINDVLRLTSATPFLGGPFDADNVIDIYFNIASVGQGSIYRGGFYTDAAGDFESTIAGALFNYYLADPTGSVTFEDNSYSLVGPNIVVFLDTVGEAADFGGDAQNGQVMQFTLYVPEPAGAAMLALAGVAMLASRPRGGRRTSQRFQASLSRC